MSRHIYNGRGLPRGDSLAECAVYQATAALDFTTVKVFAQNCVNLGYLRV